jgi:hypothetical protein
MRCPNNLPRQVSTSSREHQLTAILETQPFTDKPSDVIDDFMVSPNTKVYDSIAFSPLATPPMTLNLWRDCTINPIPGD